MEIETASDAKRHHGHLINRALYENKRMLLESGAAFLVFVYVWWWLVNRMSHHDDDEVYTAFFRPSASPVATPHAFAKILGRMPVGSHVLDIGIGSGVYLEHPPVQEILRSRKIKVDGVDIAEPSIVICNDRIRKHKLEAHVTTKCQDARTLEDAVGRYDAILYMESFPVMSKPLFLDIFRKCQRYLKPKTGVTFLYHNLGDPAKIGMVGMLFGKLAKPTIKLFLGIDFGRLTMQHEMDELVLAGAPGSPPHEDEILLSCEQSEVSLDLAGISNPWYWMWSSVVMRLMKIGGPAMEQHLITVRQPGASSGAKKEL